MKYFFAVDNYNYIPQNYKDIFICKFVQWHLLVYFEMKIKIEKKIHQPS